MSEAIADIITWSIGGLLSVIFFFVSFFLYRSIKAYDELSASVNKLQITLTGLNGIIMTMREQNDTFQGTCREKHSTIDNRLNDHARQLDEHDRQITRLEARRSK